MPHINPDWYLQDFDSQMYKSTRTGEVRTRESLIEEGIFYRATPRFEPQGITPMSEYPYRLGETPEKPEGGSCGSYNQWTDFTPEQQRICGIDAKGLPVHPGPQPQTTTEILADRGKEYGSFKTQARIVQALKDTVKRALYNNDSVLTDAQAEALDMIFGKISRIVNGNPNNRDSWADIAGYAQLVVDIIDGKNT